MFKISTRFSAEPHILVLLEIVKEHACAGENIAGIMNSNLMVVRRLFSVLCKTGTVNIC